jgi:predicted short-subunit dehydrogenase-like oxidoreductase (DUF2520 family)
MHHHGDRNRSCDLRTTPQTEIILAKKQHIVFIGAGNVATQLGIALKKAGHKIIQVYSPGGSSAGKLARLLGATGCSDLRQISRDGTLYIIAVNDDAIKEITKAIRLSGKTVVHTSGTVKMDVLKPVSALYGVIYPLQTLSKDKKIDPRKIPLCIEACNNETLEFISGIAGGISKNVARINSDQRRTLHLAAVFACNFSNHMYRIAELILNSEKIPFELLRPLILETAEKVQHHSPANMQTGPAVRGDLKTIKTHLKLLKGDKHLRSVYKLLTESIAHTDK